MPLSRANRNDRRRRVMLDAIASDPDLSVETVRVKRQSRTRNARESTNEYSTASYRDPGYSQAVRKTCQQRMVQLIPVRRGTLSIVLTVMWASWGLMLLAHYLLFVYLADGTRSQSTALSTLRSLPIANLFHLRSPNSIAHWITSQLWLITSLTAYMIFQLRRHKLDDYRARYRIWVLLAIVALFSSFDASTSFLWLLGKSIDGWAQREIGYNGWPLVLASFSSLVGLLGIRLCSELKSSPMSVASWLSGLIAWATAALLGTGLLKTPWSPATLDLFVGACWVGGILLVFQAAGIYLRQIYIHAQKRFLERQGTNLKPIRISVPKLDFSRFKKSRTTNPDDREDAQPSSSKWRAPWKRSNQRIEEEESDERLDRGGTTSKIKSSSNAEANRETSIPTRKGNRLRGLFNLIPSRNDRNEKLEAEPIREDEEIVVDRGLTKTRGWFGIGGNRDPNESNLSNSASVERKANTSQKRPTENPSTEDAKSKRGLSSFLGRSKSVGSNVTAEAPTQSKRRNWMSRFGSRRSTTISETENSNTAAVKVAVSQNKQSTQSSDEKKPSDKKRKWSSMLSRQPKLDKEVAKEKPKSDAKQKKSFMSFFDGLRLKPPTDENERASNANKPSVKPVAIQQGQALPSTRPVDIDSDDDDAYSGRPMSKAERKKQRRMQQDDRRAA